MMAAPSPPRFSAAWRVEAPFLSGVPLWWRFQIAIYLCRCLTLHDPVPCKRESAQTQAVVQMKRAQELRVDEVSVQKSRENHETTQKLTFQLHELQEQMNSMNASGEFHEVESNNSGRMSHVSSQPAMIPTSRSELSRDKRLPLDTLESSWITGKRFWNSIFYV